MTNSSLKYGDLIGRLAIVGFFSFSAYNLTKAIFTQLNAFQSGQTALPILPLMQNLASLLFLLLVISTTIIRLKPLDAADGVVPRVTALAGTFASMLLVAFPSTVILPTWLLLIGFFLSFSGLLLSAYVLSWLGRSFSIMAEARRLVVAGPYAVVRHPLYLVEEIAVVGILIMHLSLGAVLVVAVQWGLQLMRMQHEEEVLRRAFPEYAEYAKSTPKVIPRFVWPYSTNTPPKNANG
jgi:protein-S-isoprenylcysteine O-methyltransferase Ste14